MLRIMSVLYKKRQGACHLLLPLRADEAVAAGAAGLVSARVQADSQLEGAKPLREGLSDSQREALISTCDGQQVCSSQPSSTNQQLHWAQGLSLHVRICPIWALLLHSVVLYSAGMECTVGFVSILSSACSWKLPCSLNPRPTPELHPCRETCC